MNDGTPSDASDAERTHTRKERWRHRLRRQQLVVAVPVTGTALAAYGFREGDRVTLHGLPWRVHCLELSADVIYLA